MQPGARMRLRARWPGRAGAAARELPPRPVEARRRDAPLRRARSGAPEALFTALLVASLVPLWVVGHLPTQDGGNHVESVVGLLRLPHSALLQHYYLPNLGAQPNWLTQILLALLLHVTSPAIAEKLILSGYVVGLPLAFRYALPRTDRGRWAALAIFPFVFSYPFHMGFWNFSYSLVLFFVALGFWARTGGRFTVRRGLAFAGLTFVLFVAHSVSTASLLATVAAVLGFRGALDLARARGRVRRRRAVIAGVVRRALATGLYASPAIALMAWFLVHQPRPLAYRPALFDYVKHLAGLYTLVSFDQREYLLSFPVALAILLALGSTWLPRRSRRLRPVDAWLAAAALGALLYFLMPDSAADGAQLGDRLALYPFFAALLWIARSDAPVRRVRALALALSAVFVVGTVVRVAKYREIDGYLEEYLSASPHVAEESTVLPLTFAPFGPRVDGRIDGKKLLSYRVQVFQHVTGWIVAERRGVDLDNSQANTKHTPLRWRPELNPFTLMNTRTFGMEDEPPCVTLRAFEAFGGRIDQVLVWGATPASRRDACGAAVLREVEAGWERVFRSEPRGLVEVYRKRAP